MEREIERFTVTGDDGTAYEVVGYQEFIRDGAGNWIPGMKHLEIAGTGAAVNFVDDNTFKIFDTGEVLRRT